MYSSTDIQTVKIQGDGYRVNGTMSVPIAPGNRHYTEVQKWISEGNVPEPEFTETELAINTIDEDNSEARVYLASTDWYITRLVETGEVVPENITIARAEARIKVITNE